MSDDTRAREIALDAIQSADRALELCSCKSETALTEFLTERLSAALTAARHETWLAAAEVAEEWEQSELDNMNVHGANTAACIASDFRAKATEDTAT